MSRKQVSPHVIEVDGVNPVVVQISRQPEIIALGSRNLQEQSAARAHPVKTHEKESDVGAAPATAPFKAVLLLGRPQGPPQRQTDPLPALLFAGNRRNSGLESLRSPPHA